MISVPPSSPRIWSPDKKIETSRAIAGIYDEGDNMDLRCNTVGGKQGLISLMFDMVLFGNLIMATNKLKLQKAAVGRGLNPQP